ncbi:Demethylmenaquinone methyltransferase [Leucoagaricus sp. SymC.cos]|nr:Demethylmenaquinone methyltransferase [Leucoagaricus sp. SymC.cos]
MSSLRHVLDISPQRIHDDSIVLRTEDTYVRKRVWHRYGSMTLHPYPNDAVYMQSYDPVMLENEKYSYQLLRRLTSSIPTFSTSMDRPPSNVLDLGCGQGHWLLDASNHWPSAEFTGFDLVDILLPEVQERPNVQLVRGNFVKYRLPFPDKNFDFVRMANLALAIPHEKWSFVVSEARRVLKTGGQLELIDDQICFPYGAFPVITPPSSPCSQGCQTPSTTKHRCSAVGETDSDTSSPTLKGSEIADSDCTLIDEAGPKSRPESLLATMGEQRRSLAYLQRWASNRQVAQDVEETFTGMLRKRLVHPFPGDFVPDLLRYTFGSGNVSNTQTYNIKLAPVSSAQPHRIESPVNVVLADKPAHPDRDSGDCSEDSDLGNDQDSPTRATFPLQYSAKAAGRLGISYSDLVAATASARRPVAHEPQPCQYSTTRGSLQSPGIIVAPSTFIPLNAIETEFHASKWIHNVLGCRPAIFDYIRSQFDETGRRLVSDTELKDALWTYESFRRQRFHWPIGNEPDPESFATPCIANTRKLDIQRLIEDRQEPVHIRTIRVYHATKTDMTSLASLLFNSPSNH